MNSTIANLKFDRVISSNNSIGDKLVAFTINNALAVTFLGMLGYFVCRLNAGAMRTAGAVFALGLLFVGPIALGSSGIPVVDFGMPSYSFLGFLHFVDIFFIRSIDEVHSWSFNLTMAHLLAYPKEGSKGAIFNLNALKSNSIALAFCFFKYALINILLYFTPSAEAFELVKPYSLAWFGYSYITGALVLLGLGCFMEGTIRLTGLGLGIEMADVFENPLGSTNISAFWKNWNLAIKDGLGRVFFNNLDRSSKSLKVKSDESNGVIVKQKVVEEIDYSNPSATDDGLRKRIAAKEVADSPAVIEISKKKKVTAGRNQFLNKALAALLTFGASGVWHEYMNHLAFNGMTGENLTFFLLHGLATIFYSYLKKYHSVCDRVPNWMGITIVQLFNIITTPLFVLPFIRAGFFQDLKSFGIFGKVEHFVWIFGTGY